MRHESKATLVARIRNRICAMAPDGDRALFAVIEHRLENSRVRVLLEIAAELRA
jgi:hypothetical protein